MAVDKKTREAFERGMDRPAPDPLEISRLMQRLLCLTGVCIGPNLPIGQADKACGCGNASVTSIVCRRTHRKMHRVATWPKMTEMTDGKMLGLQGDGAMLHIIRKAMGRRRGDTEPGGCKGPVIFPHAFPIEGQVSGAPRPAALFTWRSMAAPPH